MEFGVLAGNSHINARIYEMFKCIDPADVPVFVRKFRSERDEQRFHTFRELIVGSYLCARGLKVRYEQQILGKTPDWVLVDSSDQAEELVDVVTLHQRRETETDMVGTLSTGAIWSGWATIAPDHLYGKIQQKASSYAALAEKIGKPYTVFLFGEFLASVDAEEVEHVLYEHHGGLFSSQPMLAGVVYFTESAGAYSYSFFANNLATHPSPVLSTLRDDDSVAVQPLL
jgi:hypothetical protein